MFRHVFACDILCCTCFYIRCKSLCSFLLIYFVVSLLSKGAKILSIPFFILEVGGVAGFLVNAICAYICCYTSAIVRDCLYETNSTGFTYRALSTYADIGGKAFNSNTGKGVVLLFQLAHALLACVVFLTYAGILLHECLSLFSIDFASCLMLCTGLLIPVAFLTSLEKISWFSFLGFVAQFVVTTITMIYSCIYFREWKWEYLWTTKNDGNFWIVLPNTFNIILISYGGTPYVPMVESEMRDKSRFNCMIISSFLLTMFAKTFLSFFVILVGGNTVDISFTSILPLWPYKMIVNPVFMFKCLTGYPFAYYYFMTILDLFFQEDKNIYSDKNELICRIENDKTSQLCLDNNNYLKFWAFAVRVGFIIVTMLMSIFLPLVNVVLGILGGLVFCVLSIIFPCLFHLILKWNKITLFRIIQNIIYIGIGVVCAIAGIYYNIVTLA